MVANWFDSAIMRPVSYQESMMSIGNRAYLYGETLFTTFRTFQGEPLFLDRHMQRLFSGANYLWPWISGVRERVDNVIKSFLAQTSDENLRVRVTLSIEQQNATLSKVGGDLCVEIQSESIPPLEFYPGGIALKTSVSRRSPGVLPGFLKKGNYLESIIERRSLEGFDEILFLNHKEELCEASTSNIFILKDGDILTPPSSSMVLEGTVRGVILDLIDNAKESDIKYSDLMEAEAVWLTRSSALIIPVTQVDQRNFPVHSIHREVFEKIYGDISK